MLSKANMAGSMSRAFRALLSGPLTGRQNKTGLASLLAEQPSGLSESETFEVSSSLCQGLHLGHRGIFTSNSPWGSYSAGKTFLPAVNADAAVTSQTTDRSHWPSAPAWSGSAAAYVPRGYACMATPSPSLRGKSRGSPERELGSRVHMLRATSPSSNTIRHPAKGTPISQGVAYMVSRDQLSPDHLQAAMRDLSTEFVEYASGYSVTEVAAWCEVCRQLGFEGDAQGAMCEAVLSSLDGRLGELTGEEVVGVLWVLALRSSPLTPAQRQELSEVLLNCAADIRIEDLPDVAATVATLGLTDAFALTELSEVVIAAAPECTPSEVVGLAQAYEDMGRTFFDDKLFKALASVVVSRCRAQPPPSSAAYTPQQLVQLVTVYKRLAVRHTLLQPTLAELEKVVALVGACGSNSQPAAGTKGV